MTLTVLIDLDDTLLQNDFDQFLPVYLKALGKHLARYVPPERMVPQLMAATKVMVENDSARVTLEEAFDTAFYPALGLDKETMRPLLEQFYDEVFPDLRNLTARRPEALQVVQRLLDEGHKIVIATNPLFPRKAILHRLAWAGLDPAKFDFALITSYESFHFAKPHPAYYAEILAQLGWPNQPAVMVGNSASDDLLPATVLGIPGYWVDGDPDSLPAGLHPFSTAGALDAIPGWIRSIETKRGWEMPATPRSLLAELKSTPAALATLCRPIPAVVWQERPAPDQWSLTEIICHMRDVDREVNLPRFRTVIDENNPFVAGINSDPWAEERNYRVQKGPEALQDFIAVREQMIQILAELSPEAWQRPARHAIFGPTTLSEMVGFVTTHDCTHLQSITALLGQNG